MPRTTANFESAYAKLNNAQRQAVDTIEGPVLVLAGPGTGKTQMLTVRIANILKQTDVDPGSILALTYTESASKEMRERLIELIGVDGYQVKICTFHGYCHDIIAANPDRFSRPAGMQNITDLEKIQFIQTILDSKPYLLLKPIGDPYFYTRHLIGAISTLKREGFTLNRFENLVSVLKDEFEINKDSLKKTARAEQEKLLNKNLDLLEIYTSYQQRLQDSGRFDYDDMINWVVESLETDEDFLLGYQEKHQYILVDEYQDTNSAQNRLLFALSSFWGEGANVFAVGDPNQSIFRFQGASKENVLQFQKAFPGHTKIVLDQNYRSANSILESSASLFNTTPLKLNVSYPNKKIRIAKFSHAVFEDDFIAKSIKNKIKNGLKPEEIAVIVRENKDIEILSAVFKKHHLPYKFSTGVDIIKTPLIHQFLKLLKVVSLLRGEIDDIDLFTVLNFPFLKLNPLSVFKIAHSAYVSRKTLLQMLSDGSPDLDEDVVRVFDQFISWSHRSGSQTLPEIFESIFQESGLLNHLLSLPQPIIDLNRFGTLFDDVKSQSESFPGLSLSRYIENLAIMDKHNLRLDEKTLVGHHQAVTLTTAHKSKGLEWRVVYIYRFADTHWGNSQKREMIKLPPGIINFENLDQDEDKNSEERRLFYVAMTRAKQYLYLTGSENYENSTKMSFPSMFLHSLPKSNIRSLRTRHRSSQIQTILTNTLSPAKNTLVEGEIDYLNELLKDFRLSPTSLNTYLDCPYKFKLDNLYRIPRAKAPAMCFGTAVHFAVEKLYTKLNNTGKVESKADFLQDFKTALMLEILSQNEFQSRLAHGQKVLSGYYDRYHDEFSSCLFTEKSFGTSLTSSIHLDDIPLTGKADRIDLVSEKDRSVRFVDYKTGKVRTRGEIEGTTKNSNGDYFRQLTFYHLLADLDQSFPYQVAQTELDFIEPDSRGEYRRERFTITDSLVDDLKTTIRNTAKQIRSLEFPRTTDTHSCSRCPFVTHCWPEGLKAIISEE